MDLASIKTLMDHSDIATTMRYAHLSHGHLMSAVQSLNGPSTDTRTDTAPTAARKVSGATAEVVDLKAKNGGEGETRTHDLGIMSRSEDDDENPE